MPQTPLWKLGPFIGLFLDPFIEGTPLGAGHLSTSISVLVDLMGTLLGRDEPRDFSRFTAKEGLLKPRGAGLGLESKSQRSLCICRVVWYAADLISE